jgi:hypothetical protein
MVYLLFNNAFGDHSFSEILTYHTEVKGSLTVRVCQKPAINQYIHCIKSHSGQKHLANLLNHIKLVKNLIVYVVLF